MTTAFALPCLSPQAAYCVRRLAGLLFWRLIGLFEPLLDSLDSLSSCGCGEEGEGEDLWVDYVWIDGLVRF